MNGKCLLNYVCQNRGQNSEKIKILIINGL